MSDKFRSGEIIMLDGLYGCSSDTCNHQVWGISGRRFPRLACGHEVEYRLIRRRVDHAW
jgi:hypothetical protein